MKIRAATTIITACHSHGGTGAPETLIYKATSAMIATMMMNQIAMFAKAFVVKIPNNDASNIVKPSKRDRLSFRAKYAQVEILKQKSDRELFFSLPNRGSYWM